MTAKAEVHSTIHALIDVLHPGAHALKIRCSYLHPESTTLGIADCQVRLRRKAGHAVCSISVAPIAPRHVLNWTPTSKEPGQHCKRAGAQLNMRCMGRHHRRLPIIGDIQPEKNLAISGRSAFRGVESLEGEFLESAAALETFGDAFEVLRETHALDRMGACPLVLGSCVGVSTHVAVDTGTEDEGACTACTACIALSMLEASDGLLKVMPV